MQPHYVQIARSGALDKPIEEAYNLASKCRLCPRECGVRRLEGERGFCQADAQLRISRFIRHLGEEPVLSGTRGSGTVFFSHCPLRCKYCQNWQISFEGEGRNYSIEEFARGMLELQAAGVHNINWVTPSHYLPWVLEGLKVAVSEGLTVPLVYNCSGYESLDALELLEGVVDIYLPDAKYADVELAKALSSAADYPRVNRSALAEMYRQVGDLDVDKDGVARNGLIVRHLIIPNELQNTRMVLDMMKDTLGTNVAISLMGQYFPTERIRNTPYDRTINRTEYQEAADYMLSLGFSNGWVQEGLGVELEHRPDFREKPNEMW